MLLLFEVIIHIPTVSLVTKLPTSLCLFLPSGHIGNWLRGNSPKWKKHLAWDWVTNISLRFLMLLITSCAILARILGPSVPQLPHQEAKDNLTYFTGSLKVIKKNYHIHLQMFLTFFQLPPSFHGLYNKDWHHLPSDKHLRQRFKKIVWNVLVKKREEEKVKWWEGIGTRRKRGWGCRGHGEGGLALGCWKWRMMAMWRVEGDGNWVSARRKGIVLIRHVRSFLCTPWPKFHPPEESDCDWFRS